MTKFIGSTDGQYVNVGQITGFYLWEDENGWYINAFISSDL